MAEWVCVLQECHRGKLVSETSLKGPFGQIAKELVGKRHVILGGWVGCTAKDHKLTQTTCPCDEWMAFFTSLPFSVFVDEQQIFPCVD